MVLSKRSHQHRFDGRAPCGGGGEKCRMRKHKVSPRLLNRQSDTMMGKKIGNDHVYTAPRRIQHLSGGCSVSAYLCMAISQGEVSRGIEEYVHFFRSCGRVLAFWNSVSFHAASAGVKSVTSEL